MESVNQGGKNHAKSIISFVRWTVALSLLAYVCLTAVEECRLSGAESWSGILGLKTPGVVQAAARRLWGRDEESELQQQRPPRSRKLAGVRKESGFRMKMLHRNSVGSPYRKEYRTQGEALREDMAIDGMRLAAFQQRTQRNFERNTAAGGSASAPAITAVIEGPSSSASPSTDYNFQSPLVSGSSLGSGQYFVDFYLGTPPQKFSLIVDSGSDLIWVQCAPCKRCYQQDGALYTPGNSSSFKPVPCLSTECLLIPAIEGFPCDFRYPGACAYEYQYADTSSTRGVFAFETATLDASSSNDVRIDQVAFGCGTDNEGSFAAAGGVIGLGQGPLSFTSQIGYAYGNKFSYCLVNYLDPTSVSSSLVFGDESAVSDKQNLQYTPILKNRQNPSLYYIQIVDVSVAGEALPIPPSAWSIDLMGDGGSVFDSGTTLTYFVPDAYSVVLGAFDKAIPYPRVQSVQNLDLCFNISGVDNPSYPSFSIQLQGDAVFQPPGDNYFVDVAPGVKCLAMQGLQSAFGFNTIGNLLQQNFLVVYDRDNHRIGFSPTQCSHL